MNAADSERLAGVLENELGMYVEDGTDPDVVVFNTCSIRDHAEQKLYDTIGPYAGKKRDGKSIALVVTGCVAQQEGEALLRRVPELDVVMGPQYVTRLKSVLDSVDLGHQVVATAPAIHSDRDFSKPIREHPVKAWVNVIYGCNEHCTYCVVPSVRGMEQSRPMEAILEECRDLAAAGYREVTLLGQNIDAYGRDMVPKRNFADLLKFLNANLKDSTNMRIRYVTSHPRYFSGKEQNNERNTTGPHEETAHGGRRVLMGFGRGCHPDGFLHIFCWGCVCTIASSVCVCSFVPMFPLFLTLSLSLSHTHTHTHMFVGMG